MAELVERREIEDRVELELELELDPQRNRTIMCVLELWVDPPRRRTIMVGHDYTLSSNDWPWMAYVIKRTPEGMFIGMTVFCSQKRVGSLEDYAEPLSTGHDTRMGVCLGNSLRSSNDDPLVAFWMSTFTELDPADVRRRRSKTANR